MSENTKNQRMPFGAKNYALMAIGVLVIVVGFILMSGGGDHTATEFDSSIYSTRRITIAPIVVIVGFVIEIFAIMLRFNPKNRE
jgi:TRAP-type C4-dicarboxylate transport system permease small subunit